MAGQPYIRGESPMEAPARASQAPEPVRGPYLSVVLPVFNEAENLTELHRRLVATLEKMKRSYELIFVDDGSSDGSFATLAELHARDPNVKALSFSRNFGHHIAITAGVDAARGQVVALMDSDLQDQPEALPILHEKLLEGFDVVWGVRETQGATAFKAATSWLFLRLLKRLTPGAPTINSNIFRMARRSVIDEVKRCREQARFITGLFSWAGFRQIGVAVPRGVRYSGETKYTLFKMVLLALNTITSFSHLPLRIASALGVLLSGASLGYGTWLIVKKFLLDTAVEGWTSIMVGMLFLGGIQLLSLGVLGEYVGRIYTESQRRPLYVIARRLGDEAVDP